MPVAEAWGVDIKEKERFLARQTPLGMTELEILHYCV